MVGECEHNNSGMVRHAVYRIAALWFNAGLLSFADHLPNHCCSAHPPTCELCLMNMSADMVRFATDPNMDALGASDWVLPRLP
jgi:hypothetical protein